MKPIFLDTSFLLALSSPKDEFHSIALRWQKFLPGPFITTEFVFLEVADGFAARGSSITATKLIDALRASVQITIVPADAAWIARGYKLFSQRSDKQWGLTDCTSFEVMRDLNISDALTHDHHFDQAGFRALLREEPPSN